MLICWFSLKFHANGVNSNATWGREAISLGELCSGKFSLFGLGPVKFEITVKFPQGHMLLGKVASLGRDF